MGEPLGGFDPQHTYDSAAEDYEDASQVFWQHVAERSVERLDLQPGDRVLDVPCGTGTSLVSAAQAVGPTGRITGIDYAPGMVAIARRRVEASGLDTIDVRQGDMRAIPSPPVPYDAVVCALGVFFVEDMAGLVRSFLDLVQPTTGRLVVGVFGEHFFEPLRTTFVRAVADVAPNVHVVEPWRRTEHEPTLRELFDGADIEDLSVTTDSDRLRLRDVSDCWRIVMGSGLRHTVQLLGDDQAAEVRGRCEAHITSRGITHLVTTSRYARARRASAR